LGTNLAWEPGKEKFPGLRNALLEIPSKLGPTLPGNFWEPECPRKAANWVPFGFVPGSNFRPPKRKLDFRRNREIETSMPLPKKNLGKTKMVNAGNFGLL